MRDALSITWRSFRDLWDELAFLIALNVLWTLDLLLVAVPLFGLRNAGPGWVLGLSLLILLPLPVLSAGLCFVANQGTRGVAVGWGTFAAGVRRYWAKGLVVALTNAVVLFLIAVNIRFYLVVIESQWGVFAVTAWAVVALYWLLAQLFWFPMLLEMKEEKLFLALRHALGLVIVTPGFSIVLGLVVVLLIAVCVVLTVPAVLFLAVLLMLIANHATRSRIAHARRQPYEPGGSPS
ncbi:MAG TPA: hypothetical protein PKO09_13820 [Anaerolineae bacterium]|nr:hypothetical protein [Anaerolineae bacterium]